MKCHNSIWKLIFRPTSVFGTVSLLQLNLVEVLPTRVLVFRPVFRKRS